jgi:tetratricopeptide (TPR) repeat protein
MLILKKPHRGENKMDAKEQFREGQFHLMRGELEDSVGAFTKAIDAGYDEAMAYLSRGAAYMKLKKAPEAIADFTKAIERDPQSPRAYFFRGSALMLIEELERAIEDLSRALELNPEHGAAFFARATCHAQLGHDEEATRDMKTALVYAETAAQGMADTIGLIRTHFDMAMALLSGERKPTTVQLTEEEQAKVKKWLEEGQAEE